MIRLAACLMLLASPALAQQNNCAPYALVLEKLADEYGEHVIGRGITNGGNLFEVFTNSDGGSWTIVERYATGAACLRASGVAFESVEVVAEIPGIPG